MLMDLIIAYLMIFIVLTVKQIANAWTYAAIKLLPHINLTCAVWLPVFQTYAAIL